MYLHFTADTICKYNTGMQVSKSQRKLPTVKPESVSNELK